MPFPRLIDLPFVWPCLRLRLRCAPKPRRGLGGLVLTAALLGIFRVSAVSAVTVGSGFSAMWFDPARNGEGLQLEILDSDRALVEWYTFDEHGAQRWLQGVGQIVHEDTGDSIHFPQLYMTHGGRFGPDFNPGDVQTQIVGSATLSFSDCGAGTFHYAAFDQSQTLPIVRLTQTMGAGCTPINGVPGQPVMAYAGQSGSWFDVAHSGEGFALQWMSRNQAIVTWYTYDTTGNQIWLLGLGDERDDGSIVFDQLYRAHGPHFGTTFDPASFQADQWGSLTLQLDCNGGTAHYTSSDGAFGSGDLSLTRLTQLKRPGCPTVKPKFSDLYDITWTEIPIALGTPAAPNYVVSESIANDGTIAGRRDGHLVLWHPDTQVWEDIPRQIAAQTVEVSPDASAVIATDEVTTDPNQPIYTLKWQRGTGWQPLPGDAVSMSIHYGISHNSRFVVGVGRSDKLGPDEPWVREIDGSQQLLPSDHAVEYPFTVSNDGATIVGIQLRFPTDIPEAVAVRWDNGLPSIIHSPDGEELAVASACDAGCDIIFGAGLYNYDPTQPHPGEAWYLKTDGTFGYLGALPDAFVTSRGYGVADVLADGSLAVGTYGTNQFADNPDSAQVPRVYFWTEATGIVSLRSLTAELGIGDDNWSDIFTTRISANGRNILIGGVHPRNPLGNDVDHARAVVLQLVPRSISD
jgi:hypothetical protein